MVRKCLLCGQKEYTEEAPPGGNPGPRVETPSAFEETARPLKASSLEQGNKPEPEHRRENVGTPGRISADEHDAMQVVYEGTQHTYWQKYSTVFKSLQEKGYLAWHPDGYVLTAFGDRARRESAIAAGHGIHPGG